MHKKIESELMSLAHSILQMKNKEDLSVLTDKVRAVYERLTLLQLINRFAELPTTTLSREELMEGFNYDRLRTLQDELKEAPAEDVHEELSQETTKDDTPVVVDLFSGVSDKTLSEVGDVERGLFEGIEELQGTIDLDVATNLLEGNNETELVLESKHESVNEAVDLIGSQQVTTGTGKSLNDMLFQKQLQVGLNDRIAFVKNLFGGSQEEFNRVISQLNSFSSHREALDFITKLVKPDYHWEDQEELEMRFLQLIERKFS